MPVEVKIDLRVKKICEVLQISRSTFFKYGSKFISIIENPDAANKMTWGGRRNFFMTEDEEKKFLSQFIDDVKKKN
jgi:hypothetical protein